MLAVPPPAESVGVGVSVDVSQVSTASVPTDVCHVQVVRKTTYESVTSQAYPEVAPIVVGMDVEIGMMRGGLPGPHPVPVVLVVPVALVPGIVRATALVIYGVDCR